jgi:hypothetical protein
VIALKVAGETQVHTFDILGDSENAARPQFGPTEPTGRGDLARWVEPVRPFDVDFLNRPHPSALCSHTTNAQIACALAMPARWSYRGDRDREKTTAVYSHR